VREAREAWKAAQPGLDPARLAFLDEAWAATNMTRRYGRAPRGRGSWTLCRTATER
jgi:hypothetical protein